MWKSFRGLAAENMEKFPWVSRGKCGKNSVGGCQAATCGHLRPLEWLQVAAENVEKFPWEDVMRPLAATWCHLRPVEWLQEAASGCRWQENAGGHLRPLEWLQVAASGCRWQENAGGHLRSFAATRVAASGCKWLPVTRESGCHFQNQITRLLRAQCILLLFENLSI